MEYSFPPFYFFNMTIITKLASAIYADVISGLRGFHGTMSMSEEQLEDDVVDTRLAVIKEYSLKGILPLKDMMMSVNCVPVDCKDIDRCSCSTASGKPVAHFKIPQIVNTYGEDSIEYIGSTDKSNPFIVYYTRQSMENAMYRKYGKDKPYVWVDTTPGADNMCDCYIFNGPFIKQVSVTAIFKDPRQLEGYACCSDAESDNINFIDNEVKKRVTERKIRYYRQFIAPIIPQNGQIAQG